MRSIFLQSNSFDGRVISLSMTQESVNKTTGTSEIHWLLGSTGGNSSYYHVGPTEVKLNGNRLYYALRSSSGFPATTGIQEGYVTVSHNTDGTLTLPVSLTSWICMPTSMATQMPISQSITWELDPIIKEATLLTATNFTDDENPTITYDNPLGNTMVSLQAAIVSADGSSNYAAYRDIPKTGSTYTFELTDAERNALRNAATDGKNVSVIFLLKSVASDGNIFVKSLERTCTVSNAEPQVLASIVDVNPTTIALTGNSNKLVRYHSNAQYTVTATAYKGATITKVEAENGSQKLTTATGVFNAIESGTFKFTATDSRGYWKSATMTPDMVAYVKLTCNFEHDNPTTTGDLTFRVKGNYFSGSFGATSNTLNLQYRFKYEGSDYGNWVTLTPTFDGSTYSAEVSLTGLDYQSGYIFQARAADKLNANYVYSPETYVISKPIFHWGKDDFVFEVPVTFNAGTNGGGGSDSGTLEGDVNITGNLRLKGTGNYGNALYFGDGKYCYLQETTDDDLTIHASDLVADVGNFIVEDASKFTVDATTIELNGTTIKINGEALAFSGTWTPTLDSDVITAYYEQQGWYTKTGKVVTVGFYVQAECNSGHSGTSIRLSGMPYTPGYYAAGGGECHFSDEVFTIASDFGFWEATTSSTVIAKKSNNELFKYYSDGGLITCSGTITYTTA